MTDQHLPEPVALARRDAAIAFLVFLLAAFWLVSMAGGRPDYGFDGVTALHVAQNIADGEGATVKGFSPDTGAFFPQPSVTKPIFYPGVTSLLISLGVSHEYAAWIVSGGAWAVTAAMLYVLARQALPLAPALLVPLLYATHVTSLRWGITVHEQALFVGLSVATLWRLTLLASIVSRGVV